MKPDHLRDSVVELLRLGLEDFELRDRWNTLGLLVDLASACGFTEVEPKLRDWIRSDHYAEVFYNVDGHSIPLRQTLWSTLIAWGCGEEMTFYLKRDLGRPQLESGALCFSALGRLSPADAIAEIPSTHNWPAPYWHEVLRSFLQNFSGAPRALVQASLLPAWEICLSALRWDPEISETFKPRWDEFVLLLKEAGIDLRELYGEDRFDLKPIERPSASLEVDLSHLAEKTDEALFTYYDGLLEGASSSLTGAQSFGL